jgi:hypothetical protein
MMKTRKRKKKLILTMFADIVNQQADAAEAAANARRENAESSSSSATERADAEVSNANVRVDADAAASEASVHSTANAEASSRLLLQRMERAMAANVSAAAGNANHVDPWTSRDPWNTAFAEEQRTTLRQQQQELTNSRAQNTWTRYSTRQAPFNFGRPTPSPPNADTFGYGIPLRPSAVTVDGSQPVIAPQASQPTVLQGGNPRNTYLDNGEADIQRNLGPTE